MQKENSKFPSCFPENFEKDILPSGAEKIEREVYRIIKNGEINRDSFLSTFEETKRRLRPPGRNDNIDDPGYYGTSCNLSYESSKHFMDLSLKRHHPQAILARGVTKPECGPSQITKDRKEDKSNQHVDWWIYKNSSPELYFKEVNKNEE